MRPEIRPYTRSSALNPRKTDPLSPGGDTQTKRPLLIRGARQILSMIGANGVRRGAALGDLGLIESGAILVVDGKISQIGVARRIENLAETRYAREIDVKGRVVLPGFVDSHTHLPAAPVEIGDQARPLAYGSYRSNFDLMDDVVRFRALTGKNLESNFVRWIGRCVRHGTTTIEAKSGYGLEESSEMRILRLLRDFNLRPARIIPTFYGARITPPEFAGPSDYLNWISEYLLPKIRQKQLARFVDINCGSNGFDPAMAASYLEAAVRMGFKIKIHAGQDSLNSAAKLALHLGAASVDGLDFCSDEDMQQFALSRSIATLLPIVSAAKGTLPNGRRWVDAGAPIAIATDFTPCDSPAFSMLCAILIAHRDMKLTLAEAISAATINAAHAVMEGDRIGSLEYGKEADLIALNVSDYREIPFCGGANLVGLTMLKGEVVYQEAEVVCPQN